jgi:hypothetical protein
MNRTIYTWLGILQALVGLGAIPAGLALIADPTGSSISLPIELLEGTPFPDFLIPGVFLFLGNGVGHLAGALLSFRKSVHAPMVGMLLGLFLSLWIVIQIYFIGGIHFLQTFYLFIGVVELTLSYRLYRKNRI